MTSLRLFIVISTVLEYDSLKSNLLSLAHFCILARSEFAYFRCDWRFPMRQDYEMVLKGYDFCIAREF